MEKNIKFENTCIFKCDKYNMIIKSDVNNCTRKSIFKITDKTNKRT